MKRSQTLMVAAMLVVIGSRSAYASGTEIDAAHEIVVDGEQLRVTSRWYGHLPGSAWQFAAPLPPGTRALDRGATLTVDPADQRVIGIHFAEPPAYPLVLELEIPWTEADPILALPLPPEPGWQRIEIEGEHRLILDPSTGLLLHATGYYGPGDLHVNQRMHIDRGLDWRHPAGAAYVPGAVVREAGGVPARLESGAARRLGLAIAAGGAFVGGLLVLTVVVRRSTAAVEVEDAEAYLDSEFDELTRSDASEQP